MNVKLRISTGGGKEVKTLQYQHFENYPHHSRCSNKN